MKKVLKGGGIVKFRTNDVSFNIGMSKRGEDGGERDLNFWKIFYVSVK